MTSASFLVNSSQHSEPTHDRHPPAVIVGADADGLAAARSLARSGVPVIMCDSDSLRPGMHSRYVSPFVLKGLSGSMLVDGLLALRPQLTTTPLLFLTSDPQVSTISECRERLRGACLIRMSKRSRVRQLMHKISFQQFAEDNGFSVPRAVAVTNENDLAGLSEINFPAVIKPGNKEFFFGSKAPRAQKVLSRQHALLACRKLLPQAPDLIVQEWIQGEEQSIYFCLQYRGEHGVTVGSFTGRKLRCWPPETGSTASCTAAPEADCVLTGLTQKFFDKAEVVGFCSMEFKFDRCTRKFYMIEPTIGRSDWQEEVAVLNGFNLPLAAYRYEVGLPPLEQKPGPVRTWFYPPSYVRSVICSRSSGGSILNSPRPTSPCWQMNDPVPSIFFLMEWTRKLLSPKRWKELYRQRERVNFKYRTD
jgi:D-aspartate ligase